MYRSSVQSVHHLFIALGLVGVTTLNLPAQAQENSTNTRVTSGLQVLYHFAEEKGNVVHDVSGAGVPVNLKIANEKGVRRTGGALTLTASTILLSEKPASRLSEALKRSGEITVEAWITPSDLGLSGPARIVTISKNSVERNVTLGQDKDKLEVRLRTTKTSTNGLPSTSSKPKAVAKKLTHIVYTRNRAGIAKIYLNGQLNSESKVEGDFSNWNSSFQFALGNEMTNDRPWLGTYHLVALYNKALPPQAVVANFKAGSNAKITDPKQMAAKSPQEEFFENKVAGIFVRHCFECHDSSTKEGGLNLSKKVAAVKGGDSGVAFVAGNHAKSPLWKSIEADDMPANREPLSAEEKEIIKKWIDTGAVWSLDQIDPEVYLHEGKVAGNWIRRLTIPEYIETVRAAVGVDISKEARELLPPDLRADGFSNTSYNLNVDLKHVNAYSQLAEIIVSRMDVEKFASRFTKKKRLIDDDMRDLAAKMGKWILRGPLTEREIVIYRGISTSVASAGGDYREAVAYTLQAMLQSPRFLYRIESQRGDGSAWPVNSYELASRVSYTIWGGPPDQELMRAAEAGELFDRAALDKQVQRMLKDQRAIDQSVRFVNEWLDLQRLDNLRPNKEKFPNWNASLAVDMRKETQAYFQDILWDQKRPLVDLLNAQSTFLTPELAKHYNLNLKIKDFEKVDLKNIPSRGGLLTQGSILTKGGDEASMISRGLFVLHDLLRGAVKDPPPCVDTTPIPTKPGRTQRVIAMERLANGSCGGCHAKFETLAFSLEKFDGLGSFSEADKHGNKLREDGEILFPGDENPIPYQTSAELMDLLAKSDRVNECLSWKVAQFAIGRPLVPADVPIMKEVHQTSQKNGGTWSSLISALIQSDLIQTIRTEPVQ